ncbi:MAG: hypothetical protein GXP33_06350 [Spirochaetes bacterium]|nr:hypothetical protein [Spirochaetota bacterium]
MACKKVETLTDLWAENGILTKDEYNSIIAHIKSCRDCSLKYSHLMPFINRDVNNHFTAGTLPEKDILSIQKYTGFHLTGSINPPIDSIMDNVLNAQNRFNRNRRLHRVMSAAAAVVIIFLSSIFLFSYIQNSKTEVLVKFSLTAPEARSVSVVGDFNNWQPSPLIPEGSGKNGIWELRIKLKKGRVYTYNFLIDGKTWIPDPASPIKVKDDFGGESSLIHI